LNLPVLVYNRITVRLTGRFWCLNDMHKAAGGDPNKRPSDWLVSKQAKELIDILTTGNSGSLVETIEGRKGGTWADRRIAISYAKYLSPEFHAKCNEILLKLYDGGEVSLGDRSIYELTKSISDLAAAGHRRADQIEAKADHAHKRIDELEKRKAELNVPIQWIRKKVIDTRGGHAKNLLVTVAFLVELGWNTEMMARDVQAALVSGCCRWCPPGHHFKSLGDISLDIRNPSKMPDYKANTEWVCMKHNRMKNNKSAEEFSAILRAENAQWDLFG
jgi:hypothetical protein